MARLNVLLLALLALVSFNVVLAVQPTCVKGTKNGPKVACPATITRPCYQGIRIIPCVVPDPAAAPTNRASPAQPKYNIVKPPPARTPNARLGAAKPPAAPATNARPPAAAKPATNAKPPANAKPADVAICWREHGKPDTKRMCPTGTPPCYANGKLIACIIPLGPIPIVTAPAKETPESLTAAELKERRATQEQMKNDDRKKREDSIRRLVDRVKQKCPEAVRMVFDAKYNDAVKQCGALINSLIAAHKANAKYLSRDANDSFKKSILDTLQAGKDLATGLGKGVVNVDAVQRGLGGASSAALNLPAVVGNTVSRPFAAVAADAPVRAAATAVTAASLGVVGGLAHLSQAALNVAPCLHAYDSAKSERNPDRRKEFIKQIKESCKEFASNLAAGVLVATGLTAQATEFALKGMGFEELKGQAKLLLEKLVDTSIDKGADIAFEAGAGAGANRAGNSANRPSRAQNAARNAAATTRFLEVDTEFNYDEEEILNLLEMIDQLE